MPFNWEGATCADSMLFWVTCRLIELCTKAVVWLCAAEMCCCRRNPQEDPGRQAGGPPCFLGTAEGGQGAAAADARDLELKSDVHEGRAGLGTE